MVVSSINGVKFTKIVSIKINIKKLIPFPFRSNNLFQKLLIRLVTGFSCSVTNSFLLTFGNLRSINGIFPSPGTALYSEICLNIILTSKKLWKFETQEKI